MNQGWRKIKIIGSVFMFCLLTLVFGVYTQAAEEGQVTEIQNYSQISALISKTWEADYFGKIIIDAKTGDMEKDGKKESFSDEFGVSEAEGRAAVKSDETVEQFLEEQVGDNLYEVEENEDGDIEVTAPYQTKRLIVEQTDLYSAYGASEVYYNEEDGEFILQFETQEKTKEAAEALRQEFGDDSCYPDEVFYIDDILMTTDAAATASSTGNYSWGVTYMGMNTLKMQAPVSGYQRTVTAAVLDTGIDTNNFMFKGRTISPKSYSFIDNNTNIKDVHGHGTHVAGTIADATPSNVQIMMLKISNNEGYSSVLSIRTALQYAVKQKVDVINMSIGFIGANASSYTALDSIIKKAYNKGIPICAAAGNDGIDVNYCYPACNAQTIAVAALDTTGYVAYYSNRGSKIDFCAPGSEVVSAKNGGTLVSMSGTSMAAPHITAAITYIKSMQSNLSVAGVYKELKLYSKDLGSAGRDNFYGWGCPILTNLYARGITYRTSIVNNGVGIPKIKSISNGANGIQISWTKVSKATKYYVYRKKGNGSYKKIAAVTSKKRTYVDKKASQGKQYTYVIKAVKSGKVGYASGGKTIVRLNTPKKVKAKSKAKKLTVTWKKQNKVTGYQIQYSRSKKMKQSTTVTLRKNVRKTVINGLKKKTYYYRVRSYIIKGNARYYSSWSLVEKKKVR